MGVLKVKTEDGFLPAGGGGSGEPGADGFSPVATVTQTGSGAVISITDKSGTTTATVFNGKDGKDGAQGIQGEQGPKGDTGAPGADGAKGDKGDKGDTGAAGKNGADGYTPVRGTDYWTEADKVEIVQRVIESLGGNPIFGIVDENNNIVVSGDLPDGTYSVKYEMENGTKLNIGNLVIDTNVYYTVTNTLTQCTTNNSATKAVQGGSYSATITAKSGYELKFIVVKMGGTDISSTAVSGGKITISNVTGNIVITAAAEEIKAAYTNILTSGKYTIEKNKRWSGSAKSFTACNGMIGFLVPTADVLNKTIRFKGFTKDLMASGQAPMWMNLDAGKARLNNIPGGTGNGNIWSADALVDEGNGVYSVTVNATFAAGSSAYIVIDMAVHESTAVTSLDGLIMTINEPIA